MRRLFDLIIDILLFFGDFICHMPSRIISAGNKIGDGFYYVFTMLPYKISIVYRFRRMWYPTKSDFKAHALTNEKEKWLNDNLGKYRWKVITRLTKNKNDRYYTHVKKYLCFRYKTDAVAFKLRWTE